MNNSPLALVRAGAMGAAALLSALPLWADRVVTTDGRVLSPKKARAQDAGYVLTFEHGEIVLPDKSRIKEVEIEGDMADYVPANEDEKAKLAQGFVRYQGRWYSKIAYEQELKRQHQESKKRADELALHSNFANAWVKQTSHFELRSNTSPELLDFYGDLLETYYAQMDKRFSIKVSPSLRRTKMVVKIFKNRREFNKLTGTPPGVAGFFDPNDVTLNFYQDYEEPSISEWVALHEGTHLITHMIEPQYKSQIWLNEGLADYFGSAEIERGKNGKLTITPGKLQTDRVLTVQLAIQEGKAVPLAQLFSIEREDFGAFEYAHAWSFIYFLNETPKYKKGFDRFFKDIYSLSKSVEYRSVAYGKTGAAKEASPEEIRRVVMTTLVGKNDDNAVAALDKEWKDSIAAIPIEGPVARFKRAYRAVIQGQSLGGEEAQHKQALETALLDLDFAIDQGIDDARAWWTRARVRTLMGKPQEAREDLLRAIEMDPLNAGYRFEVGMTMMSGVSIMGDFDWGIDIESSEEKGLSKAPEAKPYLGLAAALAPGNDLYQTVLERYLSK